MNPAPYRGMNPSGTHTMNRIAAGSRSGGQFTHKINGEQDIDLTEDVYEDNLDESIDDAELECDEDTSSDEELLGNTSFSKDSGLLKGKFSDKDATKIVETFYNLSQNISLSRKYGNTVVHEDAVQEAALKYMIAKAKNRDIRNDEAFSRSLVSREYANTVFGKMGSQNRLANKYLRAIKVDFEAVYHRQMTDAEEQEHADRIRDSWYDYRHRPSEDFHKMKVTSESLESVGVTEMGEYEVRTSVSLDSDLYEDGHWQQAYYEAASTGGTGAKNAAMKFAWNALAESTGDELPFVTENSLSRRQAGVSRANVKTAGGVLKVANDWLSGNDNANTQSLFSPFGSIGENEKYAVAERLAEDSERAEKLWKSALSFAENV